MGVEGERQRMVKSGKRRDESQMDARDWMVWWGCCRGRASGRSVMSAMVGEERSLRKGRIGLVGYEDSRTRPRDVNVFHSISV